MSMTRKDFDAIAAVLREYKIQDNKESVYVLANKLCVHFKQANPTFDKGKFLRACGFYQEG